MADHAFAQGDLAGAEEYLRGALRRMPTLDLACYRLARVQALQGRVPEARNTAGQCRRLFPGSWRDKTFETWLEKQTAGR